MKLFSLSLKLLGGIMVYNNCLVSRFHLLEAIDENLFFAVFRVNSSLLIGRLLW